MNKTTAALLLLIVSLSSCGTISRKWVHPPEVGRPEWATRGSWTQIEADTIIFHGVAKMEVLLRPALLQHTLQSKLRAEHSRLLGKEILKALEKLPRPKTPDGKIAPRTNTLEPVSMFLRRTTQRSVLEKIWTDPDVGGSYAYGSLEISPKDIQDFILEIQTGKAP